MKIKSEGLPSRTFIWCHLWPPVYIEIQWSSCILLSTKSVLSTKDVIVALIYDWVLFVHGWSLIWFCSPASLAKPFCYQAQVVYLFPVGLAFIRLFAWIATTFFFFKMPNSISLLQFSISSATSSESKLLQALVKSNIK